MSAIAPETIEQVKAKYTGVELHLLSATVVGEKHQVIVKSPPPAEYQEFRDYLADDSKKTRAYERLLRSCVVHPETTGLDAMLSAKPGLTATFGSELIQIAGAVEDVEAKKL
jgi:hypothetical protein